MAGPNPLSLPFDEAIRFFRDKLNVPTERWTDLWQGMHARAFTVAGATKEGLLADLRSAVQDGLANGTTIEDFRSRFDEIVKQYGWSYKGGRDWRSRVIFDTNMRTSYAAGRWQQIQRTKEARPYLMYKHSDHVRFPRPEHVAWDGTVLPVDDPWWNEHYPPNDWGCQCYVVQLSDRDLQRNGLSVTDPPQNGTYEWTNPNTGETIEVPDGIGPGWAYNVGRADTGTLLARDEMSAWARDGERAYDQLSSGNWQSYSRPELIPREPPPARPGPRFTSIAETAAALKTLLGADEAALLTPVGRVTVDAKALAEHVPLDRTPFLSMLPGTLADPFEVWIAFEQHKGTGKVVMRQRYVRAIDDESGRQLLVVAQANRGRLEAWTVVPVSQPSYINRQRVGRLVFTRS